MHGIFDNFLAYMTIHLTLGTLCLGMDETLRIPSESAFARLTYRADTCPYFHLPALFANHVPI